MSQTIDPKSMTGKVTSKMDDIHVQQRVDMNFSVLHIDMQLHDHNSHIDILLNNTSFTKRQGTPTSFRNLRCESSSYYWLQATSMIAFQLVSKFANSCNLGVQAIQSMSACLPAHYFVSSSRVVIKHNNLQALIVVVIQIQIKLFHPSRV